MKHSLTMADSRGTNSATRRRFLGALAGGAVVSSGCLDEAGGPTPTQDGEFAGETLRVAPWSGPYAEFFEATVASSFEEQTGATVEVIPEWAEIVAKVRAAPPDQPPYDVMAASAFELYTAATEGLLMEIDINNLSNLDDLYPFMQNGWRDQYLQYGPPVDGTSYTIVYDTEAIDFEPSTWKDIMRDEVTDAAIDGAFWIDPAGMGAILTDVRPGVEELYDEQYHEQVFETIRTLRDNHLATFTQGGADFWEQLRQEIVTMGQVYYGSALGEVRDDDRYELSLPSVTNGYYDNYVRVRGTDGKDEIIEAFLDHMLDVDVQTDWHAAGTNMMSNRHVEYISPADTDYPTTNEDLEKHLNGFIQIERMEEYLDVIPETVHQIVAGN